MAGNRKSSRSRKRTGKKSRARSRSRFNYKKSRLGLKTKYKKDTNLLICSPGFYKRRSPTGKIVCARLPRRTSKK